MGKSKSFMPKRVQQYKNVKNVDDLPERASISKAWGPYDNSSPSPCVECQIFKHNEETIVKRTTCRKKTRLGVRELGPRLEQRNLYG
ncbi:hypothetical protein QE152_g6900 [Popillia japonica]|uniref:Uncharacterized protein n=1 Tax=Popillia japonica TaxID=7064 RepID=A0AAW1MGQ5_POPJA